MHASKIKNSCVAVAALLCGNFVSAVPAIGRAITEPALNPWVTVDASGNPSTVTPVLTTISGVATTINPAPAALTATTTSSTTDDSAATTTASGPASTATGGGSFEVCHNLDGEFAPFCQPANGSSVYPGDSYYVVWDTNYFANQNSTVVIQANYVNASGGGKQAFQSDITPNTFGFISWTIDKAWMKGLSSNNVTLVIVPLNPSINESPGGVAGPTLMVTNEPGPPVYHQPKTKAPKGESLYIALPTVFGFIIVCLVGGYFVNRKHRKIGLGNVMGRRKGYGVGKSRAQRMGRKEGAIRLREQELTSNGQYRDAPVGDDTTGRPIGHARADSDALGSLAGTPTEERTNYFRDEMRRQEPSRS